MAQYTPNTWTTGDVVTKTKLDRLEAGAAAALPTTDAPELIRDTIGTALVAGANTTVTVNDAGDTITIASSGGGGTVVDASTTVKGIVQLAGDLAGTATSPTVPGLANKTTTLTSTATKTGAYTAAVGDLAVMNVAGGATTLTLPTAPADKAQVGFLAIGATTAVPLVVNRGGSTDTLGTSAATSVTVPLSGEVTVYQYQAASTRWLPVSNVKPLTALDARYLAAGSAVELDAATNKTLTQNASATGFAADSGHTHRLPNPDGSGDISLYTADGTLVKLHSVGGVVGAASGGGGTGVASLYPFGDGSDGAVTINTTVTLTRDMHYTDLTVASAGVLKPDGWRIYVKGTLTVQTGGVIQNDGTAASGPSNGFGGGGNQRPLANGSAGASGSTVNGAGAAAPALTNAIWSLGGAGGTGGASGANVGGLGGSAATLGSTWTTAPYMNAWKNPVSVLSGQSVSVFTNNSIVTAGIIPGSGGGSGANDATGSGGAGGGGGGGGFVLINANAVANSGAISANGGVGGAGNAAAARNGGGGGGGGGGVVFVTCNSYTGTQPVAAGGAGGAGVGTGSAGSAGANGTVLVRQVA